MVIIQLKMIIKDTKATLKYGQNGNPIKDFGLI